MNEIEKIMSSYPNLSLKYVEMPTGIRGLIVGDRILLDCKLSSEEKLQWLYEELGHYETTVGNITTTDSMNNKKQERKARVWGMKNHVPEIALQTFANKHVNDFEVADDLGVNVEYLREVGETYGFNAKSN
ncbi:ImmA/IrrE family metallo-endopeptidase [Dellaglioa sp. BT-FLS60]